MSPSFETTLHTAVHKRVFPGAVAHFARGSYEVTTATGALTYADSDPRVTLDTIYDLASLTKLFTLTAFLAAAHEYSVAVETPVRHYFPAFDRTDKSTLTLRQLLHHNAGIKIAIQSLCDQDADAWLSAVAAAPLHLPPGTQVRYCCTNFWLLARITEQIAGTTLDTLFVERLLGPLALSRTTLKPLTTFALDEIAPTEVDAQTGIALQGIVHDEASRAWQKMTGTCAGNAGLFGTASDVARFAHMWLHEGENILPPELVRRALTDVVPEGSNPIAPLCWRGWGWQKETRTFAPPDSWGHSGFTGPTLWIAPQREELGVVLNNRVHPTRNGPYRMVYHRRLNDIFAAQVGTAVATPQMSA